MQNNLASRRVYGWGKNYDQIVEIAKDIQKVSAGQNHLILITKNNQLYALGSNKFGQLALPSTNSLDKPQRIMEKYKVVDVACGAEHTFFITDKHEIYSCGLNIKGQLGIGTFDNVSDPKLVVGLLPYGTKNPKSLNTSITKQPKAPIINVLERFDLQVKIDEESLDSILILDEDEYISQISCGSLFTVAVSNKGRVFGAGFQCISRTNQSSEQFMEKCKFKLIVFNEKISEISCGLSGCAALTKDGTVYVWGKFGKIHNGVPKKIKRTSQYLGDRPENQKYMSVKVGDQFVVMLSTKGEVYSFGENIQNQLGVDSIDVSFREVPEKVQAIPFINSISVGRNTVFGVSVDKGQIIGWGSNKYGQVCGCDQMPILMMPTNLKISIASNETIVASSYCTYLVSGAKIRATHFKQNLTVRNEQEKEKEKQNDKEKEQMVKLSEYRKLLMDYQALKSVCLSLSQKNQPIRKESKECQTSSKFEVTGVTKYRQFDSNLQIGWSELTIESQINEGGYGIIYKAKWRQTTVAVKKFKIQNGDVSVRDFLSQCHAMEAVRHPNIVMFLGAVTQNPNYSIVLQYCSRGSLWSYLQDSKNTIKWQERRRMAIQIAQGVLYLHLCNPPILHRDLKSLNIFLDGNLKIKIGDFGWTKTLEEYMTNKIGTYQWMAPEVIGSMPYTEKVDVFSYSIILWQIASREPPYKNISGPKVSQGVLNNELRPPIPPNTPESYVKLMKKCWMSDPNRRPNFRQIIKQLEIMKL